MADLDIEADDRFANVDVDSIISRVERRPLTFCKKRSLLRAPEFIKRLTGEETVDEGATAKFETRVLGLPRPVLRWFKDEDEIVDHPRIRIEFHGDGKYVFIIETVNKGDEAAYRCRAENDEGISSSTFFLSVKAKPRSPKRGGKSPCRRTVSYPPMFPTIVEKVEEEEKAARETAKSPPSPLTQLYDGITLQTRHTWPDFLGDWAFANGVHRNGGSLGSDDDSDFGDGHSLDSVDHDDVFSEDVGEKSLSSNAGETPSFYLQNSDSSPSPDETNKTKVRNTDKTSVVKIEQNNNETKSLKGAKRDMHLPLSNGILSSTKVAQKDRKTEEKNTVKKSSDIKDTPKRKSEKDLKKTQDKDGSKKLELKDKSSKKTEKDSLVRKEDRKEKAANKDELKDKSVKKEEHKDKITKKNEVKEKSAKKEGQKERVPKKEKSVEKMKKSEQKDSGKPKMKCKDTAKMASEKDGGNLKSEHIDQHEKAQPKQKPGDKEGLKTNPEKTGIPGRKYVEVEPVKDTTHPNIMAPITCSHAVAHRHGNSRTVQLAPPAKDKVFGKYLEEFVFVLCLFTFASLCFDVPSGTFVMVVLALELLYLIIVTFSLS